MDVLESKAVSYLSAADRAASQGDSAALAGSAQPANAYGACDVTDELESKSMIPGENTCRVALFLKSWGMLCPVLGPLFVIISLNLTQPQVLTMECQYHHSFAVSVMCASTLPGVRIFPRMGLLLGVLLLAWRMLHERAYYVLLKNQIMVDLDAGKRFGFWVLMVLTCLFVVACLHFCIKFFYGHPCTGDSLSTCNTDDYMFKNTFLELLTHPSVLADPPNHLAQVFWNAAIMQFVLPGVVTLTTLAGLLNIEGELTPASKMFESEPCKVYRDLGDFVFIREATLRSITREDGLEICTRGTECSEHEVFQELYVAAQKKGCQVLSSESRRTSITGLKAEAKTALSLLDRTSELLRIDWWPAKLLLEPNLVDAYSVGFKHVIGIHYWAVLVLIIAMMCLTLMRIVEYSRIVMGDAAQNYSMLIALIPLCVELCFQITWLGQVQQYAMGVFAISRENLQLWSSC